MQTVSTTGGAALPLEHEERDYRRLLADTRRPYTDGPLFTTDVTDLWGTFLSWLPPSRRQHYDCRTCRHFVERFGGLVHILESGVAETAFWHASDGEFFADAIDAMRSRVLGARVTGVFLTSASLLGTMENPSPKSPSGTWHHLCSAPTTQAFYRATPLKTAEQAMAGKHEEYGMLCRGLGEFPFPIVSQAHTLLTSGTLYRSEKCIGVAKWLLALHDRRNGSDQPVRDNVTWLAVATAPPGFCHVRTTMIGTLLEDLVAGKPVSEIKRAFDAKMSPILYQRPQAHPTDGQIAAANSVIEKLRSAGSLKRRYAWMPDVIDHAIWTPKALPEPGNGGGGVFDHLKRGAAPAKLLELPAQVMTWSRFRELVLPGALRIELYVPSAGPFFGLVTAQDFSAPPILQWDRDDARNPVSWYLYHGGSGAHQWGLTAFTNVMVDAILPQPSQWGAGGTSHHGEGAYFILRGARDSVHRALHLFPETLRSEYHPIRAAIEAYSKAGHLEPLDGAVAGICMQKSGGGQPITVRVTTKDARAIYNLDRWE